MSSLPPTVAACIDQTVAQASKLLDAALEKVGATLDELGAGGRGDWRSVQDSARELHAVRKACAARFPTAWRNAIRQDAEPAPSAFGALDALTLVDDEQLVKAVESGRLAQDLAGKVDQSLAELDAFMSAALGLEGIDPAENPLRPEPFARALQAVLSEAAREPQSPSLWLRYMAPAIAPGLAELYRAASGRMQKAGVQQAGYRVLMAPASPDRAGGAAKAADPMPPSAEAQASGMNGNGAPSGYGAINGPASGPQGGWSGGAGGGRMQGPGGGGTPAQDGASGSFDGPAQGAGGFVGWINRTVQALRGPLIRDFLGGRAAGRLPTTQQLEPTWYQWVDQQVADLEAAPQEPVEAPPEPVYAPRHVAPADRPVRAVGTGSALDGDNWGRFAAARERALLRLQLLREARQVGQVMGLQVVRQLLDEVARDPRLLAPVREALVAVEPALARLALHAPEFLGQKEHPARQLLDSVAERSLRYNEERDPAFAGFMEPVRGSFKSLNDLDKITDGAPFEQQLEQLQARWAAQDEHEVQQRSKLVEAVRFAERRQAEAERIAQDLSARSDLDGVPPVLQEFLFERWSLVLAHARLSHAGTQLDPGGYLGVIADLLWSVKPEIALREPARAFDLLPRVITKLRDGLQLLGQTPAHAHAFFAALEELHRPIPDLRAKLRKQTLPPSAPLSTPADKLKPAAPQKPALSDGVWLAPGELQVCGFEDPAAAIDQTQPFIRLPEPSAATDDKPDPEAFVAQLQDGSWVDLFSQQRWRRARLTWSGKRGSLFMFVSEGGRPHSMTRRTLLRLVDDRLVRAVNTEEVVQRAIDALARAETQPVAA